MLKILNIKHKKKNNKKRLMLQVAFTHTLCMPILFVISIFFIHYEDFAYAKQLHFTRQDFPLHQQLHIQVDRYIL